jgi:peptidoglycan L-alanyl-D-glutamate endopeptidase CwlK
VYGAKIKIDGDFGPETKAACRAVAKGDKGLLVSILQAGLMVNGIWETKIDASFGNVTEKAVREFQEKASITVDGSAGPETFEKLFS